MATDLQASALSILAVVAAFAGTSAAAADIVVTTSAELQAAMVPQNEGRTIRIAAGEYDVSAPLLVPDGATVLGSGHMTYDGDGLPYEFAPGTRARLKAAPGLIGSIVTLGHESRISRLTLEDVASRLTGNAVQVASDEEYDVVSAEIDECEIVNPRSGNVELNGPAGRGLAVITRQPRATPADAPVPHVGSALDVAMRRSIIRSPGNASGVFAGNFAPMSRVSLHLEGNVVGGGIIGDGGVSRPLSVTHSSAEITSRGNLYRSDGAAPALNGWWLHGGSNLPFPTESTSYNVLRMHSVGDRIEGFQRAVNAAAGVRQAVVNQPANGNTLELEMHGTRISSLVLDFWLFGAEATAPGFATGDGNRLLVLMRGVQGSGEKSNEYWDAAGPGGSQQLPEYVGSGNRLVLPGNANAFGKTNDDVIPAPGAQFHTSGH